EPLAAAPPGPACGPAADEELPVVAPAAVVPAVPARACAARLLPPPPPPPPPPESPMTTFGEPWMSLFIPPHDWPMSFTRQAALPLMLTNGAPFVAVHMFMPQQTAWIPLSWMRSAGIPLMKTSGEPMMAGPTAVWGQAGQQWASPGPWTRARSPSLPAAGKGFLTPANQTGARNPQAFFTKDPTRV